MLRSCNHRLTCKTVYLVLTMKPQTLKTLKTQTRPVDTNQVSAGLFVPLSAQPTRPATLHSELSRAHEYNNVYTVKSQKVLGDYQCLLRITFTRRKSTGPFSTMG